MNLTSLIPLLGAAAVAFSALGAVLQRWDRASRIKRMTALAKAIPEGSGRTALVEARDVLAIRHGLATSYVAPGLLSSLRTFFLMFGLLTAAAVGLSAAAAAPGAPNWLNPEVFGPIDPFFETAGNWTLFLGAAIQGGLIASRRLWVREELLKRLQRPRATGWRALLE